MTAAQRIAVITGANRGLGRSTALSLANEGVDAILTYHANAAEADDVVASLVELGRTAVAFELDTGAVASFDGFVDRLRAALGERWGRDTFDFLINNAGIALMAPFAETTEADFDHVVNVQFKGVYFLTQKLLPLLADGGGIVNLSSGLTRFTSPGQSAYASAKGAIDVLTRYLAKELGPRQITVNAIAPGPIGTDFAGGIMRDDEQYRTAIASQVALGRVGEPDDIGAAIASLLTSRSRWITGQRIEASGGTLL